MMEADTKPTNEYLRKTLSEIISKIQYGSVRIIIQDSYIIQIEKQEKKRYKIKLQ